MVHIATMLQARKAPKPVKKIKTVGIREVRDHFAIYLAKAQHGPFLVLNRNKPCVIIQGVDGLNIEDILSLSKEFEALIENKRAAVED